jgi:hypothetical protein
MKGSKEDDVLPWQGHIGSKGVIRKLHGCLKFLLVSLVQMHTKNHTDVMNKLKF